ncbi:hypothetical protein SAMN05421858_1726 [Haladaptatus litoreus]|uniref:Ig-like domain-containing protein n=1 Tax=Haladaptatus litoreus TaxID=553468 RepID=A0A1N6YUQ4_9EURY|nr:hypothetical protein [Haladaptatus litoreus]SIR18320.1 hypothetical protein SAMN05421858_1726 [Haladaptatus litoreus]
MKRRRFAALLGLAGLPGCVGVLPSDSPPANPVSIRVRNYFDSRHAIFVSVHGLDSDEAYESEFSLWPGWVGTRKNVLEAGEYEVRVEVDNGMWRVAEWDMWGCETNTILVDVGMDGIGITATCQNSDEGYGTTS